MQLIALLSLLLALVAKTSAAQVSEGAAKSSKAAVTGIIHDSIAQMPLAGAIVQVVPVDGHSGAVRTAISDDSGHFAFPVLSDGHYTIGFLHPMLDSLGLEPPLRHIYVGPNRPVRGDLAIPGPTRIREAICGQSSPDSGSALIGTLRDAAESAPVFGATITAEWLELTFGANGVGRRLVSVTAITSDRGWFALCSVPRDGAIDLSARKGKDSTDRIELRIPVAGFLRRDLYLASSDLTSANDTTLPMLQPGAVLAHRQFRPGRLSGTVLRAADGKPVGGAMVYIAGGPETKTNDHGGWTLAETPSGTRVLHVRAVGYYPARRIVDVRSGITPIETRLSTIDAVLDTVQVTAARPNAASWTGFEQRRRSSGAGRFITPADIVRHPPVVTSNIFRTVPGLRMEGSLIKMRGVFEEECLPAVYLDGHYRNELTAEEIDEAVSPDEVAGIEIYAAGSAAPPQFQPALKGCGSIVIWTRTRPAR